MQLRLILAALLAAVASPASAGLCALTVPTPGVLAMSSDGLRLGSEEGAIPVAGTLTIASIGASTLTVDPPAWTQVPALYQQMSETREVRYSAPVSGGTQAYTNQTSSITVPNLINAIILTVNVRITNSAGFAAGTYTAKTVVTCS